MNITRIAILKLLWSNLKKFSNFLEFQDNKKKGITLNF